MRSPAYRMWQCLPRDRTTLCQCTPLCPCPRAPTAWLVPFALRIIFLNAFHTSIRYVVSCVYKDIMHKSRCSLHIRCDGKIWEMSPCWMLIIAINNLHLTFLISVFHRSSPHWASPPHVSRAAHQGEPAWTRWQLWMPCMSCSRFTGATCAL